MNASIEPVTYELAIIGGGVAGLIAAAFAARAGKSVIVLEAGDPGGRAQTRTRAGFAFNQGPHALYAGGALHAALKALDVAFTAAPPSLAKPSASWGGKLHPLPVKTSSLLTLTPLDLLDRWQFGQQMLRLGKGDFGGVSGTLRDYTANLRPRVAALVEGFVRLATYADAATHIDAAAALRQVQLSFGGVLYVDGGWGEIVAGLVNAATAAGATVRTPTRVTALDHASNWCIRLANAEPVSARQLLLAIPPADCTRLVPSSAQLAAAAAAVVPLRAVALDLALSSLPRPANSFALGIDEPLYFSVHSEVARLAPTGGALIQLARYLAPGEAPAPAHLARLEALADQLQPGWRDVEVDRQRLTGIVVAHDMPQPGRARMRVNVTDMPGLWCAGDWIGDEGMLSDASAASARAAVAAMVSAGG